MKNIMSLILVCIICEYSFAQINGNGDLKTIQQPIENLKEIQVEFNANITLDYTQQEMMTITADENILEYIGINYNNGTLILDQIKWIEPSKNPTITIGSPYLEKVYQGTHSTTYLKNVNAKQLTLEGNVGKINVSGKTEKLIVEVEGTDVDLINLEIEYADITTLGSAKIELDKVNQLQTKLDKSSSIKLISEPQKYIGQSKEQVNKTKTYRVPNPNLAYVKFKLKNNSARRNHFIVQGPKRDGSNFSYGFPMMPYSSKSENWPVGTKIFKESKSGGRNLLVTIAASDDDTIVKLFD